MSVEVNVTEIRSDGELYRTSCPQCGGEIVGCDLVPASAMIDGWEKRGGKMEPVWSGDTDIRWDGQYPENAERPYGCQSCLTQFSADELSFTEDGEDAESD